MVQILLLFNSFSLVFFLLRLLSLLGFQHLVSHFTLHLHLRVVIVVLNSHLYKLQHDEFLSFAIVDLLPYDPSNLHPALNTFV